MVFYTYSVCVVLLVLQIIDMKILVKNHAQESAENNSSAVKTENSISIPIIDNDKYELSFSSDEIKLTPIMK